MELKKPAPFSQFGPWFAGFLIGIVVITNAYEWNSAGTTITLERLFAGPLFIIAILYILHKQQFVLPIFSPILIIIWICWALLGSVYSDVANWSLKMFLLQAIASIFYFLIIIFKINPVKFFYSKIFLIVAWFFGPIVVCVYFATLTNTTIPEFARFWLSEGGGGLRIRASIIEPNLFGSFLLMILFMMLGFKFKNKFLWLSLFLGLNLALVFSFSRMPWIAYPIGICVYFFLLSPHRFEINKVTESTIIIIFVMLFLIGISFWLISKYGQYDLIGRVGTINTRLIMWKFAFPNIIENPLLGNGMLSLSKLHQYASGLVGSESHRSIWISNLFLAIVHDTGLIGLALFCSFLWVVLKRGVIAIRHAVFNGDRDIQLVRIGAALIATGITLIITGQSIPAHTLGFFWVIFGLIERVSMQLQPQENTIKVFL